MSRRNKKYVCVVCGYVYSEAAGDLNTGIEPGTKFEDLPDCWLCPDCMIEKSVFRQLGQSFSPAADIGMSSNML